MATKDFVTYTPNTGSNNGTVSVTVSSNTGEARNVILNISGGGVSKSVSVEQEADPSWLNKSVQLYLGNAQLEGLCTRDDGPNASTRVIRITIKGCIATKFNPTSNQWRSEQICGVLNVKGIGGGVNLKLPTMTKVEYYGSNFSVIQSSESSFLYRIETSVIVDFAAVTSVMPMAPIQPCIFHYGNVQVEIYFDDLNFNYLFVCGVGYMNNVSDYGGNAYTLIKIFNQLNTPSGNTQLAIKDLLANRFVQAVEMQIQNTYNVKFIGSGQSNLILGAITSSFDWDTVKSEINNSNTCAFYYRDDVSLRSYILRTMVNSVNP